MNVGTQKIAWARATTVIKRLVWGAQEVGLARTLSGLVRLAALAARRPSRWHVRTATSGLDIAFNYPTQLRPSLVVFQDLLEPELGILQRLLGPGRVAIDVGASIGTWTLCAAKTGATVYSCEPDPESFSVLNENVLSNGFASRVTTYDWALGAAEGWGTLSRPSQRHLSNVRFATDADRTNGKRVHMLEHFVHDLGLNYVDVLKVNTAGCERDVLAGGMALFRQQKVGMAMFLDGLAVRPLLDELLEFSYTLGVYDGRRQIFIPVDASHFLDEMRPGPMNRFILVKSANVTI